MIRIPSILESAASKSERQSVETETRSYSNNESCCVNLKTNLGFDFESCVQYFRGDYF